MNIQITTLCYSVIFFKRLTHDVLINHAMNQNSEGTLCSSTFSGLYCEKISAQNSNVYVQEIFFLFLKRWFWGVVFWITVFFRMLTAVNIRILIFFWLLRVLLRCSYYCDLIFFFLNFGKCSAGTSLSRLTCVGSMTIGWKMLKNTTRNLET